MSGSGDPPDDILQSVKSVRLRLDAVLREAAEERSRIHESCLKLAETRRAVREGRTLTETSPIPAPSISMLTKREVEVLRMIAEGLSTKQIAGQLNISFKTAVTHRSHLLQKLGMHESASLVRIAIESGLVPARKKPA